MALPDQAGPPADHSDVDALRDHYDSTDQSAALQQARLETHAESDPMVTTSLRLPRSLLEWVRDRAAEEHVRPTALLRRWIEERRSAPDDRSMVQRLDELEKLVGPMRAGAERTADDPTEG